MLRYDSYIIHYIFLHRRHPHKFIHLSTLPSGGHVTEGVQPSRHGKFRLRYGCRIITHDNTQTVTYVWFILFIGKLYQKGLNRNGWYIWCVIEKFIIILPSLHEEFNHVWSVFDIE